MTNAKGTEVDTTPEVDPACEQPSTECPICGGPGGWPGMTEWVNCKPCGGTGIEVTARGSVSGIDEWTEKAMLGMKRMAVDEAFRKQVMAFRRPDICVDVGRLKH